jgi:hypothetical protein
LVLATPGRSKCWSASARLRTACSSRRAPACMMSSMWACSSPHKGDPPAVPAPLPPTLDGQLLPAPERALRAQLRRDVWHVLIKWHGLSEEDAT